MTNLSCIAAAKAPGTEQRRSNHWTCIRAKQQHWLLHVNKRVMAQAMDRYSTEEDLSNRNPAKTCRTCLQEAKLHIKHNQQQPCTVPAATGVCTSCIEQSAGIHAVQAWAVSVLRFTMWKHQGMVASAKAILHCIAAAMVLSLSTHLNYQLLWLRCNSVLPSLEQAGNVGWGTFLLRQQVHTVAQEVELIGKVE